MGHGHHDGRNHHLAEISPDSDRRWLLVALALISTFMAGEVAVGLLSGSLALLSDAAHMLTDAGAIGLALVAMRLSAKRPSDGYTYGLKRAEIVSAMVNGVTLLVLGAWLGGEAIQRLVAPPPVSALPVLVTALVGVVVNLLAVQAIGRANRTSLNVQGAYLHVLTDLFAFAATAAAGLVMLLTGFTRADGIATLVVVALMIKSGVGLIRDCGRIFLEAAPAHVHPPAVGAALTAVDGVVEVQDLHIWQITSSEPALSAHVLVAPECDCHAVCYRLERLLHDEYGIHHSTLQVDHAGRGKRSGVRCSSADRSADRHRREPPGSVSPAPIGAGEFQI
ncbi:MAG: cation transporter [Dactylosporangium sp.]|nr:cation diffusion facilitator family transporter [Dactylosporangium sp.]NNJ62524.1 cation transporter [Dactylosporangium sp.]